MNEVYKKLLNVRDDIDLIIKDVEASDNQIENWIPFADTSLPKQASRGEYRKKYPEGCVIHFNAGRQNPKLVNDYLIKQGYTCLIIDREGVLYQTLPLNLHKGWHAGKSKWLPDYDTESVNNYFIGIEVLGAGKLDKKGDKYFSWYNEEIPSEQVRYSPKNDNIVEGYYHKFTDAQEDTLFKTVLWMLKNNSVMKLENVCGHDNVSPIRKNDVGASLSTNMTEFRAKLKAAL